MTDPLSDYGDFAALAPLLVLLDRVEKAHLPSDGLTWVLPSSVLPGVTAAYGIPVIRAEVPEPLLAFKTSQVV